jgi:hypothetical protein
VSRAVLVAVAAAALFAVPATTTSAATHVKVFDQCRAQGPHYKPRGFIFACADAGLVADHLHWSSWSSKRASGRGTGHANDCNPSCAAGHFHSGAMTVTLSSPGVCPGRPGVRVFRKVHYAWVHGDPAGPGPRSGTQSACP